MDYGKRAPDLGWRMTDAWLSMAGAGSKGLPNGVPVDEWGIRMEAGSCNPVGASVSRGGAANGPAAVYAIRKWDEWLRKYAPPGAASYDFYQSLPALSQGNVAPADLLVHRVLPHPWWLHRAQAIILSMPMATRSGAWRLHRMAPTGLKARNSATRTPVHGPCSNPPQLIVARRPGSTHSSWFQKRSTSRKAMLV